MKDELNRSKSNIRDRVLSHINGARVIKNNTQSSVTAYNASRQYDKEAVTKANDYVNAALVRFMDKVIAEALTQAQCDMKLETPRVDYTRLEELREKIREVLDNQEPLV